MSLDRRLSSAAAALREHVAPEPVPLHRREHDRRRVPALAVLSIVTAVAAGTFALTRLGSGDPHGDNRVVIPRTTPSQATPATTCGDDLPLVFRIPHGYTGPVPTASAGAPRPATPGQLVRTWTADTGHIEIRWPADPETIATFAPGGLKTSGDSVGGVGLQAALGPGSVQHTPDGRPYSYLLYFLAGSGLATMPIECTTVQVSVFDVDDARVTSVLLAFSRRPVVPQAPLVASTVDVAVAPAAGACQVPVGAKPSPNQGGPVAAGGPYPTPQDALRAFVAEHPFVMETGYVEMHLPDGAIAFGVKSPGNDMWVTVVHVVSTDGGWTVESWDGSGC
jgi:hypothetical protein